MTATIHHLHTCPCGRAARPFETQWDGEIVAYGPLCAECRALTDKLLTQARPIYVAMMRAGIDQEIARDTLVFMLNAQDRGGRLMGGLCL